MSTAGLRISRRQALALAAGGAAGAAGLRLATLNLTGAPSTGASAAGASGAWASPLGDSRGLAAHLLRRAGFAYSQADLDRAAGMSYADLVDSLVTQTPQEMPAPADVTVYTAVTQAWYAHMATTSAQFPERMALFWHGLLTTDFRKQNRFPYVFQQNRLFRTRGTGDLRTLLLETTYDPAMMRYLDLDRSSASAPNENYSRELMELFTLGVGNYSESDVREGARALSGIRIAAYDQTGARVALPRPAAGANGADRQQVLQQYYRSLGDFVQQGGVFRGALVARQHDQGDKTYLGSTGNLGPEEVIDRILAQPACAVFLARKALVQFSVPDPADDYVKRVADAFRASKYDIRTLMRTIFLSDEFRAPSAYRALVRQPADYMVAVMRVLNQPDLAKAAVQAGQGMDQVLYDPPTVGGWPANSGWVSSSAWLARVNFAQAVVNRGGALPDPLAAVHTHLDGILGADTAAVFNASSTVADRWYALLAGPEFHLK